MTHLMVVCVDVVSKKLPTALNSAKSRSNTPMSMGFG
jgi:hypothetical protein